MDNTMEDYSRGCESGWTVYFEQSRGYGDEGCVHLSEEEGMSMVSDASSGPAQVSQETGTFYSVWTDEDDAALLGRRNKAQRRSKRPRRGEKQRDQAEVENVECHLLDDTASSSPGFNYSSVQQNDQGASSSMRHMMDFSQDHFSSSYFQVPI